MEIPEGLKDQLLKELKFVIKKVDEEPDTDRKLYFLSAAHGAINRTIRFCLQNELLVAYSVLNASYMMLFDRVNRIKGGDVAVQIPDNWAKQMVDYLSELVNAIEENQSIYPALEKIIRLAHSTTGPGYYVESFLGSMTSG